MNSIDEIFALPTWEERMTLIKRSRRTPMPDVKQLKDNWFPDRHSVNDEKVRHNMKTLVKDSYFDTKGKEHPAEFEDEPVARISLPIEQDIVNIHVAFSVGNEPLMKTESDRKSVV